MLHGQTRYNIASRFFEEIPDVLCKSHQPRAVTYATLAPAARESRGGYAVTGRAAVLITEAASPWRIGQNVMHPKFGAGVIVNAEGRGQDARVQVNFHRNGHQVAGARIRQAKRRLTL